MCEVIKLEPQTRSTLYDVAYELYYKDMEFVDIPGTDKIFQFHKGEIHRSRIIKRLSDNKYFEVRWLEDKNGFSDYQSYFELHEMVPFEDKRIIYLRKSKVDNQ